MPEFNANYQTSGNQLNPHSRIGLRNCSYSAVWYPLYFRYFIVDRMEIDKTRWSCPWNSDQNCTQNSVRVTSFCLPALACWCQCCQCCQLSRILGQSDVSDNTGFWPFDRQVVITLAALFDILRILNEEGFINRCICALIWRRVQLAGDVSVILLCCCQTVSYLHQWLFTYRRKVWPWNQSNFPSDWLTRPPNHRQNQLIPVRIQDYSEDELAESTRGFWPISITTIPKHFYSSINDKREPNSFIKCHCN